jgi:hypothetical protein
MVILQKGDWIRYKLGIEPGLVFQVGKDRCAATFFAESNDDGSPAFADDYNVRIDEIEIITNPEEIAYLNSMLEKERKLQTLWPGGDSKTRRGVEKILLKVQRDLKSDYLAILDEAIAYLSTVKG